MRLTERDIDIMRAVYTFGFLTCLQIATLFEMHLKVCQRRLRLLVHDDYLRRLPIPTIKAGRSPNLFYPGGGSEEVLGVRSGRPRLNRETTHAMKNSDIIIQIALSCKDLNLEYALMPEHMFRVAGQEVIPDGAFMVKRDDRQALFLLENCAGTEIIRSPSFNADIETKLIRYEEMFTSNEIQLYKNYFDAPFRRFRLLYIANNQQRLKTIGEVVAEHDIHGFIWLTTIRDLSKGVFSDIWCVPARNEFNVSIMD